MIEESAEGFPNGHFSAGKVSFPLLQNKPTLLVFKNIH